MLPSKWPSWTLILIALGLTLLTVGVGLVLEPAVQAVTPQAHPTPQVGSFPPRLPYAAPVVTGPGAGACASCHTSEVSLRGAGADASALERLLLDEDSSLTLHGRLGCVTCHDGNGTTTDIAAAHENLVADPSHPRQAGTYCVPCHHDLASEYPEDHLRAPHRRILWGIKEDQEVCTCANCHGPVAHGVDYLASHQILSASMDYCVGCHEEQEVPTERLKCSGCHIGPHDVSAAMDCETCHTSVQVWGKVELAVHPMKLNNGHANLECFECHLKPNFRNLSGFSCSDCHPKPHEFGSEDCVQCHDGADWMEIDHTGIAHEEMWEPYRYHDHVACAGCHFAGYDLSTECSSCHPPAVEESRTPELEPTPPPATSGDEMGALANHITGRLAGWRPTISVEALYENLNDGDAANDPFIISVRSREHYELGHIPGAYNIPWRRIADPEALSALPRDQQIVTYCYTGHTGQVAATVLNILGYDVVNLKFGMMGWTDDADVLATEPFAAAAGYPAEAEANELIETYQLPTLDTGESDAVSIAQVRAQAFLADWAPTISADALFENLNDGDTANDPFVLSVRSPEHYAIGHVAGAYNIPWREVADVDNLAYLPTDTQIVDYCYTGHTGQVAATVLGVLGYDVTNLKFGMMGWTDDAEVLTTEPFVAPAGYPVETEVNRSE